MWARLKGMSAHRYIQITFFLSAYAIWFWVPDVSVVDWLADVNNQPNDLNADRLMKLGGCLFLALLASYMVQARHLKNAVRRLEEERIRANKNARHDPLTGLPNRRAFLERLSHAAQVHHGQRVLAVLDLDRFKPVNDLHGHATGDEVLTTFANRLADHFAAEGFVARLGGDEFAILFKPNIQPPEAERAVRRWNMLAQKPIQAKEQLLTISCSVGLAVWEGSTAGLDVLQWADEALCAAKRERQTRFAWYNSGLASASRERAQIEADLRNAISNGDIIPYFQPIFIIETGELRGFEVLSRWLHPQRGMIPPGVFIEVAEECGLVADLGWSVMERACRDARDWGCDLKLSVNFSPQQFKDKALADRIWSILDAVDFPPERLEVEITESAVIEDIPTARATIARLHAMGVSLALDDFGTGYSSLTSLRELDFDRLKIDRSFVTNISKRSDNQKIVAGIMALAEGLGVDVTAEGIETDADLAFISNLKCSLGQGFWFDKAVPAEDVVWLMETSWQDARDRLHEVRKTSLPASAPLPTLAI